MAQDKAEYKTRQFLAQVKRSVDLISYQEGTVVSRTLIEKKAGTLTLFAFEEGQGLSEHTAPFDAFVHFNPAEVEGPGRH